MKKKVYSSEEIIRKFAAKEAEFTVARSNYIYRQSVKMEELDPSGNPTGGKWEEIAELAKAQQKALPIERRTARLEHMAHVGAVEALPLHHERLAREMRDERLPDEFIETILTGWWTTCLEVLPSKERRSGRW